MRYACAVSTRINLAINSSQGHHDPPHQTDSTTQIQSMTASTPKKALVIGAHPEDCALGAGGVSVLLRRAGWAVTFLTMTDGELGGPPADRLAEEAACAAVLGVAVDFAHLPDGGVTAPAALAVLEQKLAVHAPDLLFVHAPEDTHSDHRAVCEALLSATQQHDSMLFYEGPSSIGFAPSLSVRLDCAVRETKRAALLAHMSQQEHVRTVEWAEAAGQYRAWPHYDGGSCEAFAPARLDLAFLVGDGHVFGKSQNIDDQESGTK